jgi:D-alanyl-lipoteichoic acid acyltransferase DltB (MBOAT superfamily)
MSFNSYVFWVFFALVFALYRALPHRAQNVLLLVSSYLFYGWWDWRFLSLVFISTAVDYASALAIDRAATPGRRRALLSLSLSVNLGLLGFFKYYGFFTLEAARLLQTLGLPVHPPLLDVILPAGISFYTFQTMSYTIDVYRRETPPARRFLDFALYVAFFPQLVAGPIERSSSLLPQVLEPRRVREHDFAEGLYLVLEGLVRKVVIADNLAPIVNTVFATPPARLTGLECLVGMYAFAFQIYGDFSGYSAIARGIARWMGFDLMVNFRLPYFATSPSDFWRRWHISLSTWLRDYLYIPLGGNRGGRWRTLRNLMTTMLVGGLWHGAGWPFIAWGAYHGALLCGHRVLAGRPAGTSHTAGHRVLAGRPAGTSLPGGASRIARIILMFHAVCLGWLLFRARSLSQAGAMLERLSTGLHPTPLAWYGLISLAFFAGPLLAFEAWLERGDDLLRPSRLAWSRAALVYGYCVFMLWFFPPEVSHEFIYFQF